MPLDSISKALHRLNGARPIALSPDETFVVCRRGASGWRGDEQVALRDLERAPSAAVLAVFELPWPEGVVRRGDQPIQMTTASEQYDFRDGTTWITARFIAYALGAQTFYALNLREEVKDPARLTVYAVEHDGSDVRVEAPLGAFLRSLSLPREPKPAKSKRKPSLEHMADVAVASEETLDEGVLVADGDRFALRRGDRLHLATARQGATFEVRSIPLDPDRRVHALALGPDVVVAAIAGTDARPGEVRVWSWGDAIGPVVRLEAPADVSPRWFGSGGVAVHGDTIAVGVPFAGEPEPGCVLLYRRAAEGRWALAQVIAAPSLELDANAASDVTPARRSFGELVAFAGDALAVVGDKVLWIVEDGKPVFASVARVPREVPVGAERLHALAADRGRVVVGIPGDGVKSTGVDAAPGPNAFVPSVGAAVVFERAETWHQARCIKPRKAVAHTQFGVWVAASGGRVLAATLESRSRTAGGVLVGPRASGAWDYLAELDTWPSYERVLSNVALGSSRLFQYRPDLAVVRVFAIAR